MRLARAGRYAEAEQRLREGEAQNEPDVWALDLLARIRVRQGRLEQLTEEIGNTFLLSSTTAAQRQEVGTEPVNASSADLKDLEEKKVMGREGFEPP